LFRGVGCLHCITQLDALSEKADRLAALGYQVIFVSSDEARQLRTAVDSYGKAIPFVICPDANLEVFEAFGCKAQQPLHGVFVIDKTGVILWSHRSDAALEDTGAIVDACARVP
jgi:peroxiredoxin